MHIFHLLAHHTQGVDEGSSNDDRSAVLVIVKHRDVQLTLQCFFDLKALGALDILQIDAAKGGRNGLAGCNHAGSVVGIDADGEGIHAAELLEQHRLALHDRQTGFRADIAQAQHSRAVGNDRHHVALEGILIHVLGVFLDLAAGLCHAGGVGGGQVVAGSDLHLAHDAHLSLVGLVHFQSSFIVIHLNFLHCGSHPRPLHRAAMTEGGTPPVSHTLDSPLREGPYVPGKAHLFLL